MRSTTFPTATRRALWTLPLVVVLALAACVPAEATAALDILNKDRKALGVPLLSMDNTYQAKAQAHAEAMAKAGRLFHSNMTIAPGLCAWGENVGRGTSSKSVEAAFMASTVHRTNIATRRFDWVGIGVVSSGGSVWVVQIFIDRC